MRATVTTVSAVALLAASAGSASAFPVDPPLAGTTSPPRHVVTARAPHGPHVSASRIDAANHALVVSRLSRLDGVASTGAPMAQAGTAPIVRVTRVTGGFDWGDAGIGAGLTAALLLSAAGVASLRRTPTITARRAA
jgi:hypothetical protein